MTLTARLLDSVADSYCPLLALLALAAPPLLGRSPGRWWPLLRWYLAAAAGIGMVYAVMAVDGRLRLWAAAGLDYSTHFAFATSLVVSLSALRRQWAAALFVSLGLYFVLILVLRYHGPADMLTSGAVALVVAAAAHAVVPSAPPRSGAAQVRSDPR